MQSVTDRIKILVALWLPGGRKRFSVLESLTGIPSGHWKNLWHGKQRAHEYMIQALARQWPEYALWLVTGIDAPDLGAAAPSGNLAPENRTPTAQALSKAVESLAASELMDAAAAGGVPLPPGIFDGLPVPLNLPGFAAHAGWAKKVKRRSFEKEATTA